MVQPKISTLPSKTVMVAVPVITISDPGGLKVTMSEPSSLANAAASLSEVSIAAYSVSFVAESSSLSVKNLPITASLLPSPLFAVAVDEPVSSFASLRSIVVRLSSP